MLTYRYHEGYPIIRADILPLKDHLLALKKHFKTKTKEENYKNNI